MEDTDVDDACPQCGKPVMDHVFGEAMRCAHARVQAVRALLRQALTSAEETVDASTWTRAADTRGALEAVDQALMFCAEALPELRAEIDD